MADDKDMAPLWIDLSHVGQQNVPALLSRVLQAPISGLLLRPDQLPDTALPDRVRVVVRADSTEDLSGLDPEQQLTVVTRDRSVWSALSGNWTRGLWINVDNAAAMRAAVDALNDVEVLVVSFDDETNIPLELIIAEAQSRRAIVVKKVVSAEDAIVAHGVLQHGPDAVLLALETVGDVDTIMDAFTRSRAERLDLVPAEVTRVRSIGMGTRGCVDTVTLFRPDEGILVGSTSAGGILVCAEVHYLPYMNLRPFRVNAGAVHSYVWTPHGRTAYLTDLCAGEQVLVVATDGQARPVLVGRVKSEVRPLRMIECRIGDSFINTIVQDDWHVRLFDADGRVRNCTQIKVGDHMLAVSATPGRHVGIAVSEMIEER